MTTMFVLNSMRFFPENIRYPLSLSLSLSLEILMEILEKIIAKLIEFQGVCQKYRGKHELLKGGWWQKVEFLLLEIPGRW